MKRNLVLILLGTCCQFSFAQHIQYRHKIILENTTTTPPVQQPVIVSKPTVKPKEIIPENKPVVKEKETPEDVTAVSFSKAGEITGSINRVKKQMPELITGCKLSSDPDKVAQLPIVINEVLPEMIAKLKQRYKGRLYSVTGLNMIDARLKMKLKICDKDGGKFRIEYLNKEGDIINDPNLDYYEF